MTGEDRGGTRTVILETLLRMMQDVPYDDVTVSALCRHAGISRGTFYLHYDNLDEALGELIDTTLSDGPLDSPYRCIDVSGGYVCPYGICDKVRLHPEYGALLLNESLRGLVTERVTRRSRDAYVREIVRRYDIPPKDAETIFLFQLNGCLAINGRSFREGDRRMERNRDVVGAFIRYGLEGLSPRD